MLISIFKIPLLHKEARYLNPKLEDIKVDLKGGWAEVIKEDVKVELTHTMKDATSK